MLKLICVPSITLNYHFLSKLLQNIVFAYCPWCLSSSSLLNSRNSITIVGIHMKPGKWRGFIQSWGDSSTNFYINPFTTRVPIVIGPSHTLVHELSGSNLAHTRCDHTYPLFYINPFATGVSVTLALVIK